MTRRRGATRAARSSAGALAVVLAIACGVNLRTTRAEPDCMAEYDAWVACIQGLPECPNTSVLCPTEYSALGMCLGPPP